MNKRLGVSEILKLISELPDEESRLASLATCYQNNVLIETLKYIFHPDVIFDLPEGDPPFTKNEFLDQHTNYYSSFRQMYLFIKGGAPNLKPIRRETLFVQFLEGLSQEDSKLVLAMKDKKSLYSGITYDLVYKAFPGLLPEQKSTPFLEKPQQINNKPVEIVKPTGSGTRNEELERACPFGCISSRGSQYYMPGPLTAHLKRKHSFTESEIQQFKEEQY